MRYERDRSQEQILGISVQTLFYHLKKGSIAGPRSHCSSIFQTFSLCSRDLFYAMDNQRFYNHNANIRVSQFPKLQFRPFNPKTKPDPQASKKISVGAKPTQPTGSSKPDVREEPHVEIAASEGRETSPGDDDCAGTPSMLEVWYCHSVRG
jgi:hypothetical protein